MRVVLDTNIYIFAFGKRPAPFCPDVVETIAAIAPKISLHIPHTIVKEVRSHLDTKDFKEFALYIHAMTTIDSDEIVPFSVDSKYENLGLKPADAFIGAYCEWIKTDVLISQNRHFLRQKSTLPFKIFNAEEFLISLVDDGLMLDI